MCDLALVAPARRFSGDDLPEFGHEMIVIELLNLALEVDKQVPENRRPLFRRSCGLSGHGSIYEYTA
jgi:hypothetical protein